MASRHTNKPRGAAEASHQVLPAHCQPVEAVSKQCAGAPVQHHGAARLEQPYASDLVKLKQTQCSAAHEAQQMSLKVGSVWPHILLH